jgi:hypothetical protein
LSRPKIEIVCTYCSSVVFKDRREVERQKRKGNINFFCSRSCSTSHSNSYKKIRRTDLSDYNRNRVDEYTPFREILRRCNKRTKEIDIDLPYLKSLWYEQRSKCALTGVNLILPTTNGGRSENFNYAASLDRIDSNLGYVKGNVRYVSITVNYLKNSMTDDLVLEFFEIIKASQR